MISQTKLALVFVAALTGAGGLCPLCEAGVRSVDAQQAARQVQAPDTATARLHISGMTCGTCPVTARTALRKLPGVFSAAVTLEDSLGVVRYDPRKVTPTEMAAHLTRVTGYGARVIADNPKEPRRSGQ